LGVYAITNIETYYQKRQSSLGQLYELLTTLQETRPGRYLVAMPSYEYLSQLSDYARADDTFMQQTRAMDDETQLAMLQKFQTADQATLAIVMGGVFSESIDLGPGVLSGVVVVSLGLPPQDLSKTLIQEHFDDSYGQGWGRQVAYLQPGLSRIVQAAGRLIRSPDDRGVVCLVDPRFANPALHLYFPEHWQVQPTTTEDLKNRLKTFWSHDLVRLED
jgi:Rad3-related DNA helicase